MLVPPSLSFFSKLCANQMFIQWPTLTGLTTYQWKLLMLDCTVSNLKNMNIQMCTKCSATLPRKWYTVCVSVLLLLSGGEVWEADMEKVGGGCGGPRGGQQPCSGPGNSSRTPWCVCACSHILGNHQSSTQHPGMSCTCDSCEEPTLLCVCVCVYMHVCVRVKTGSGPLNNLDPNS